jgi:leucyl aminopeptidase
MIEFEKAGFSTTDEQASELQLLETKDFEALVKTLDDSDRQWLHRQNFSGAPGQFAWISNDRVLIGWDGNNDLSTLGHLPMSLPEGIYKIDSSATDLQVIGWGLGCYQFQRYSNASRAPAKLYFADIQSRQRIIHSVLASALARDLINTPAQDMAPSHLQAEAQALADQFSASINVLIGDELLDMECGAIHAVGRAADDEPRLLDLTWGDLAHPKVTLIGKGVTFDSGGLNLKPSGGMRLMKKDMGGAAIAMGLSHLIMSEQLPIRLRLLIPAAENSVAGNAFRPGDILHTHKGLTVEIDNTDAEGRLLLCDALSIATEDKPELIIDYATLTGSARSAVGAEIAAMFCNEDSVAEHLTLMGAEQDDPVWRMPLHKGYDYMLNSKVADLVNSAATPYAGAVSAALFLKRFIDDTPWVHFDVMAFNTRNRPARPEGGEAMALRAVYQYLEKRYGRS